MIDEKFLPLSEDYQILARKYRPKTLKELVGQDMIVRLLSKSLEKDRLPHAFILTGIRGVGKTSTARIMARALNCIGLTGQGQATISPCGQCTHCQAIAEDRHIDVIEMDAASRTGVDDIREIIEAARYKAVSARYKIYIIDEVHMLSRNAFNALLKVLEEPPAQVKFIFATTEINKIPDTILSRCMRLQLKRVEESTLITYFSDITQREKMTITSEAVRLIAQMSDGSVRDGLSLLDQAMTLSEGDIQTNTIMTMLGLSHYQKIFKLFTLLIQGEAQELLILFDEMYQNGSDPLMTLKKILDLTHEMIRVKTSLTSQNFSDLSQTDQSKAKKLAEDLSFPVLSRFWQILLKGIEEASKAPSIKQAADIILLQLCYMAPLPTLDQVISSLSQDPLSNDPSIKSLSFLNHTEVELSPSVSSNLSKNSNIETLDKDHYLSSDQAEKTIFEPIYISTETSSVSKISDSSKLPQTFKDLISMLEIKREALLKTLLENETHLISYEPGHITINFLPSVPKETARQLRDVLTTWTEYPWKIIISNEEGEPTIKSQNQHLLNLQEQKIRENPIIQQAFEIFPDAEIDFIKNDF